MPRIPCSTIRERTRRPPGLAPLVLLAVFAGVLPGCGGDAAPEATAGAEAASPTALPPLPDRPSDPLPDGAQAWSWLGQALFPPPLPLEVEEARQADLEEALRDRADAGDSAEAWIWVGRREAYLGAYREAVETFSQGLERFPDDARFLRHRGHRWITLREFERARDDLARATREMGDAGPVIEPDGMPNPAGIPLTTLAFNAWYHRALAEYLLGDLEGARASWEETLAVSDNPDLDAASRYWLYLTLRRLGEEEEAEAVARGVDAGAELLENHTYRDLLLHFRGDLPEDAVLPDPAEGLGSVTALYGLGIFAFLEGDVGQARVRFQEILDRPDQWPAFGYIAAEVEVARYGW